MSDNFYCPTHAVYHDGMCYRCKELFDKQYPQIQKPETLPEKLARLIRENPGMDVRIVHNNGIDRGCYQIDAVERKISDTIVITIGTP
jgi:hypothetical protein